MKYSQATNYALHTMLYFVALPPGRTVGVLQLAGRQGLSPTYLSKILAKLVKAGLIESSPGVTMGRCSPSSPRPDSKPGRRCSV